MPKETILILIAVAVGGGIVAAIAYYVARFMRGSIKLSMSRTTFNPGDAITGSFDLLTKKPIQGNQLVVSLIGVEITKTRRDGGSRTRSQEIYRDEVVLEEAKEYQAGQTSKHEFEIAAPNTSEPGFMNSALGKTLGAALSFLGNRRKRLKWKIEARLDAKGVDLKATKSIRINMKQLA